MFQPAIIFFLSGEFCAILASMSFVPLFWKTHVVFANPWKILIIFAHILESSFNFRVYKRASQTRNLENSLNSRQKSLGKINIFRFLQMLKAFTIYEIL